MISNSLIWARLPIITISLGKSRAGSQDSNTISVGFGGGPLGKYSTDALFVLKDKNELYLDIMTGVKDMDIETFKDLLDINMKQEYSDYGHTSAALKIAVDNPEVMKRSMISLEEHISRNQSIEIGDDVSIER